MLDVDFIDSRSIRHIQDRKTNMKRMNRTCKCKQLRDQFITEKAFAKPHLSVSQTMVETIRFGSLEEVSVLNAESIKSISVRKGPIFIGCEILNNNNNNNEGKRKNIDFYVIII